MPYVSNGRIGHDPIEGGIEITDRQYAEALGGMLEGKVVSVTDGNMVVDFPAKPAPVEPEEPSEDDAWLLVRAERDFRLLSTDWLVQRHTEEISLGRATTYSEPMHQALLTYRQALRDLPENTNDPTNPEWPNEPS